MRRRRSTDRFGVLAVCTGNLCRSPMIATLLAAGLPRLEVGSAGTAVTPGTPWHPLALQALADVGTEVTGKARPLQRADVLNTPLILTAERAHRTRVLHFDPAAGSRTFLLLEAARLLRLEPTDADIGPEALAAHLGAAQREHPDPHDDDLPDPIYGEIEDFRICRARIENALPGIVRALGAERQEAAGPRRVDSSG